MATPHACPNPPLYSDADVGRPPEYDALCEGVTRLNGFYGRGIVDALGAVTLRPRASLPVSAYSTWVTTCRRRPTMAPTTAPLMRTYCRSGPRRSSRR